MSGTAQEKKSKNTWILSGNVNIGICLILLYPILTEQYHVFNHHPIGVTKTKGSNMIIN